jgi:hypothetical protein
MKKIGDVFCDDVPEYEDGSGRTNEDVIVIRYMKETPRTVAE